MKVVEMSQVKESFQEYFGSLPDDFLVITKKGRPVAVILPMSKIDSETLLLSIDPDFLAIIEKARKEFEEGKSLSMEQMKEEILKTGSR
ncbi:MAG: type II toxin-antitoxin system Phd/YefM family antitoxin [Calditrichaeota bacterium]|nr:MAG: type II toxin-antitoxin system Phd/YefM family antitoxin [Calditrichota bacterium]